jgi:hypothetical protein
MDISSAVEQWKAEWRARTRAREKARPNQRERDVLRTVYLDADVDQRLTEEAFAGKRNKNEILLEYLVVGMRLVREREADAVEMFARAAEEPGATDEDALRAMAFALSCWASKDPQNPEREARMASAQKIALRHLGLAADLARGKAKPHELGALTTQELKPFRQWVSATAAMLAERDELARTASAAQADALASGETQAEAAKGKKKKGAKRGSASTEAGASPEEAGAGMAAATRGARRL